jgi:hypothetical protein
LEMSAGVLGLKSAEVTTSGNKWEYASANCPRD